MEMGWLSLRVGRKILEYLGCIRRQASLLFLGLDDAGKSTYLSLLQERCDGASRGNSKMEMGAEVWFCDWAVKFYDLGPYRAVSHLWQEWLSVTRGVDGVVFVVDASTIRERGDEARELFQRLLTSLVTLHRTEMPILIVGSKTDKPEAMGVNEYDVRQALDVDRVSSRRTGVEPSEWVNRVKVVMTNVNKPDRFEEGLKWLLYQLGGKRW